MSGELTSMTAIHTVLPSIAPNPIAWGTYASDPDIHFFLCSFHEMPNELPDVERFSAQVAALHRAAKSPNGKFGFDVTTFQGNLPQDNTWCDTWEEFYIRGMVRMLQLEEHSQGPWPELAELRKPMFEKVIPRLLRPLETGGRKIAPTLVHGDLYYGNTGTDLATNEPIVFDACCFYSHNECQGFRPKQKVLH